MGERAHTKTEVAEGSAEKNDHLTETLRSLDAECRNCAPLTPLECVTRCRVWKMKNEFRSLRGTMENPNFIKNLFNALKNDTRLYILNTIVKNRNPVSKLQEELKKAGYSHSRDTIIQEYLSPLLEVGLASETQDQYYATTFGCRLVELLEGFPTLVDALPPHSECYEETLLNYLMSGPKTFEDVEAFLSPKIASRILNRLKTAGLTETPEERDYIFFFRSKRDPNMESFSQTERRVYDNIPEEGISAKRLAWKTGISLRRTYKYLRTLKGKKLVFARKTPKTYGLTSKGEKLASFLNELQNLIEETWISSEQIVNGDKS